MKILILCTGNTCRSQMAEGFLKSLDSKLEVFSAGVSPEKSVNPNAVQAMKEIGIDISDNVPHDVEMYRDMSFDFVITVCDHAKETCPNFSGKVNEKLHIGFEDPAKFVGTEEETIDKFREVRDLIVRDFRNWYKN